MVISEKEKQIPDEFKQLAKDFIWKDLVQHQEAHQDNLM